MFTVDLKSERDEDICLLIKVDNHSTHYLCDCGEARALGVKECMDTKAVFISHTHIDHFVNFDTLLRHQIGTGRKVIICGPEGIAEQVQNRIRSYRWNLIEPGAIAYEIREIQSDRSYQVVHLRPPLWEQEVDDVIEDEKVFVQQDFWVEYEILDHKTDSIAYLFQAADKTKIVLQEGFEGGKWVADLKKAFEAQNPEANIHTGRGVYKARELFHMISVESGKRLGIILDHAAHEANHEKIRRRFALCDEVYIECFYQDEDRALAEKHHHSYASMSGQIMRACGVKKAIPVHFSRKYSPIEIEQLITQFNQKFEGHA